MPPHRTTSTTPKRLRQKKLDAFLSSSPSRGEHQSPAARRKRRGPGQKGGRADVNEDDEAVPGPSTIPATNEDGSQSSDPGAIHFEPDVVEPPSEDEDDFIPRPTPANKGKRRLKRAHSSASESPVSSGDEEGREMYIRKGKRNAKGSSMVFDSDEEEEVYPVKKRKLVKGERPPTPEEDEVDLLDEIDEERIIESRLRTRDKRSQFQKNLEKLKRKKRGQAMQSDSSAEEDEDDEENDATPFSHARPDSEAVNDEEDEAREEGGDDEGFIVDDDTSNAIELPAEFSMNTYQDLLHHFKIICQMFVHMAVYDADEREDVVLKLQANQYFKVPLKIARRKLSGMRDSLVAGSTWKPQFRKALDKYPSFELLQLEFTVPGCDACNLGSRKSTQQGRLSGEPYDPMTYESIANSSSEEDDESEQTEVKKQFDLGRFCAKRTRTYHQFTHWEYHLFHALRDEVDSLKASRDGRGFVKVAYVNGKEPPEDLKDADAIMDWLDQRQVIAIRWQEIKTMMDTARHLEVKVGRGGDMDSD
ncbi:hypothetical protein C8Q80DRAFT_1170790 [Daedaleopsis nitida]|nr:hypothetical protein C8Q80DRAFT_1170790 [Daedaleopsis nitida]